MVRRLRGWASQVAELKVGLEDDPSVRLQLVGVDLGQILDRVTHVDNPASRRRLIRELLLGELGIRDDGAFEVEHTVVWRGSRRTLEIVYGNIRDRTDLRDEVFEPSQDGRWRLVIDYPYDAATYSAADDRARVTELRDVRTRRCWPGCPRSSPAPCSPRWRRWSASTTCSVAPASTRLRPISARTTGSGPGTCCATRVMRCARSCGWC